MRVDGEEGAGPDPRRVFVFQEYGIFPWASVWDNVCLGLRDRPRKEQYEPRTDMLADLLDLASQALVDDGVLVYLLPIELGELVPALRQDFRWAARVGLCVIAS